MEFENPVIGTIVPAPACLAIFPYQSSAVSKELSAIKVMETQVLAVFLSISKELMYIFVKNCPSMQMAPPTRNAKDISFQIGLEGHVSPVI